MSKAESYRHGDEALLRPDVGMQPQFTKKKPPKTYRYDSSLSPALDWDGQNGARELGEWLIAQIEEASKLASPHVFPEPRRYGAVEVAGLADAVARLKAMSRPFLDWAGKAERLSFDVPTVPLFVHERLSTKAILETLKGHERDRQMELTLFGDPQLPLHQQLQAYEHRGGWVNRMILGDSLVVMNSLLEYEGLGGQVQMIYIDPPYGVKFGSNFQPFVRRREVKDGDDTTLTREPEMVKAYRDTWELGLHSYLSYLRDRLLVARELLTSSGSVFVQISDENVHHVREVLDEVFGTENACSIIAFRKTTGANSPHARVNVLATTNDFILWYARDIEKLKYRQLYRDKDIGDLKGYNRIESPDGTQSRSLTQQEIDTPSLIPDGWRVFQTENVTSAGYSETLSASFGYEGSTFSPGTTAHWKTTLNGMKKLGEEGRLIIRGRTLNYKRYLDDFRVYPLTHVWQDINVGYAGDEKLYVVQTSSQAIERCALMTTDPGDLVVDPTCGSGTTAYVAEQWGRRWITIDTSRVPLALARQRLLTATFSFYELKNETRGPADGFVYKQRKNAKGEEIGGIVPHVTLKSIANSESPSQEVLVDRPEIDGKITRVTGPFAFEATIPTPREADAREGEPDALAPESGSFLDRMVETLRRSPLLHLPNNETLKLAKVRPASTLVLSAEAELDGAEGTVGIVVGPESGAVSEKLVFEAAKEANARNHGRLLVIGFAIEAGARALIEVASTSLGIPALYVQATPDLMMGDLLKTMRSSQIFSVAGLPDVQLRKLPPEEKGAPERYQVELLGLDVFDPVEMTTHHSDGGDVPAWFLDTDWNGMAFHVSQAFFPRTTAWDNLKKTLKGEFEDSVWDHLAGTTSAPFAARSAGAAGEVAVKVIDDRGNELLVVKKLSEAV